MNSDILIIGGGIGGLFAGALLAKNGKRVTVLEKNAIIGGGLQCFRRNGKLYETGMHVMGGFERGGSLRKICSYLGILDSLRIHHIDSRCMDEIRYGETGEIYRIASGKENFIKCISSYFPDESDGIRNYVNELYRLTEEVPLFYLRETEDWLTPHSPNFTIPADELIAKYVSAPELRELLAYLNPLYGGRTGHSPAYVHALINVLYINGASRFVNGSQQLADALCGVIEGNGGKVLANHEVTEIKITDRLVEYISTSDGNIFHADRYISAIHPVEMLRLVPEGTFLRGFVNRLNEIPNSYSAFSLFIDLKPGCFPYIGHTCYYMDRYGHMWTQDSCGDHSWPKGFMYMTPPDSPQGEYASRMLVHCIMGFAEVEKWKDTTIGHRGNDYEEWKKSRVDRVLDKLGGIFPGFRAMIENVYAASPLTIRDYYHTKDGAIFGYSKDCRNLMLSQLPVYTKVRNLLLTGQNINLHGICGTPLTAINTAEAILGTNTIIKAINNATKDS